jgi:hypothetical protein
MPGLLHARRFHADDLSDLLAGGGDFGVAQFPRPSAQDRRRHPLGQKRLQPGQAQILEIVALILQFILVDGQPKQWCGSPVARDEMQRKRGLIVGIEIGPVHRHNDVAPGSHDLGNPRPE